MNKTQPSLRHGLPYRWWSSEAGEAILVVALLVSVYLAFAFGFGAL